MIIEWKVKVSTTTSRLSCPNIFYVTKPEKYIGCKHRERWEGLGVQVPLCTYEECPRYKKKIPEACSEVGKKVS